MIVADTNLISYLLIDGDQTELARRVWTFDPEWAMPPLWKSEFLSVLVVAVRADAIDEDQASALWQSSEIFENAIQFEPAGERVLKVAVERNISAYDAQFVAAAIELVVPLVTADKRVLAKCPDIAISLADFVAGNKTE